jgi:hypothetical protein
MMDRIDEKSQPYSTDGGKSPGNSTPGNVDTDALAASRMKAIMPYKLPETYLFRQKPQVNRIEEAVLSGGVFHSTNVQSYRIFSMISTGNLLSGLPIEDLADEPILLGARDARAPNMRDPAHWSDHHATARKGASIPVGKTALWTKPASTQQGGSSASTKVGWEEYQAASEPSLLKQAFSGSMPPL